MRRTHPRRTVLLQIHPFRSVMNHTKTKVWTPWKHIQEPLLCPRILVSSNGVVQWYGALV